MKEKILVLVRLGRPSLPASIRWTSTCSMINWYFHHRDVIFKLFQNIKTKPEIIKNESLKLTLSKVKFNKNHYNFIVKIKDKLDIYSQEIKYFQRLDARPGMYIPTMSKCKQELAEASNIYKEKTINKYYNKFLDNDYLKLATVLDPKIKAKGLTDEQIGEIVYKFFPDVEDSDSISQESMKKLP